jgi:prepilin-type N-terminal cleavage/methylation domain-containing protein
MGVITVQLTKGLTLIEMLVALALVGVLAIVSTGFILPLRLSTESGQETQSSSLARSYLEIVKSRWLDETTYSYKDASQTYYGKLPKVCASTSSDTDCDLKLPKDWTLTLDSTSQGNWLIDSVIKKVIVKVKSANGKTVQFETLVSKP